MTRRVRNWGPGRPRYIVRGQPLKYWAARLGISLIRCYQQARAGTLEDRIDGRWVPRPGNRTAKLYHGRTLRQWADHLRVSHAAVWYKLRRGDLARIAAGKPIPNRRIRVTFAGQTMADIAERLGVSRQRVHQLRASGNLQAALDGRDTFREYCEGMRASTDAQMLAHYRPDRTVREIAERCGKTVGAVHSWLRSRRLPYRHMPAGRPKTRR